MKIAFVYDVLYPDTIGGVEKRIHEIGTRLTERGHEIHLFPMVDGENGSIIQRNGLIIHTVCHPVGLYTGGRRSVFQALWYTLHLFPVLLRTRVDIIDCQNFPYFPVIISRLIGWLKNECCIITWHEYWGEFWYQYLGPVGLLGRIIEKITLVASNRAVSVSNHTAERMKSGGYKNEISIIPNGITIADIDRVYPVDKSIDIIFIGRFIPEKHPELVVEAVRILMNEFPDLSCMMIGDGPLMKEITALIEKYRLKKNIHLTGFIADYQEVIRILKGSRVFVLPSEREGFGIVCIEALACGLPVITTNNPLNASSDHILPGCGYCAKPDAEDIADGIRKYLTQKPDNKKSQDYVRDHEWDTITCSLELFYYNTLRDFENISI